MRTISASGNYVISSSFGSSIVEGTNSTGSAGAPITFNISQLNPVYNTFYWRVEPITGRYSDFWDQVWSNRIGGEPADAFATSGFTSSNVSLQLNPDSISEPNQTFRLSFYLSVLDPNNGVAPVSSGIFTIGDDDSFAADGSHINELLFGSITHYSGDAGAQVYALYDGLLGRAPDTIGLEHWAAQFDAGVSPTVLADAFLASPEGQARSGAADNTAFLTQLYQATLHRAPDAAGLQHWLDELGHGTSRGTVASGFALSPEHLASIKPVLDAGLFVPDEITSAVARIYYTVLDRAPDATGLAYWSGVVHAGTSLTEQTFAFLQAPEVLGRTGSMSTAQFVDFVYENALGRHAEPEGLSAWVDRIDHGGSRVDVTTAIGQSAEAQGHLLPLIEHGWHLT